MKHADVRYMVIQNFILYWTSDDKERERMEKAASDYVDESEDELANLGLYNEN